MAREVTAKVFGLYRRRGHLDYIGEAVSQVEHAAQCAMLAESEGYSTETVLGAFLHDIGHLVVQEGAPSMVTEQVNLGAKGHEHIGHHFLNALRVPAAITDIARGHVDAKRYLCYKDPKYHNELSEASKMTLQHQGGPMTEEQANTFERHPRFELLVKARSWDEQAKVANQRIDPLEKYELLFKEYMEKVLEGEPPASTTRGTVCSTAN